MLLCFGGGRGGGRFWESHNNGFGIKPIFNEKLGKSFSIEIDRNSIPTAYLKNQNVTSWQKA